MIALTQKKSEELVSRLKIYIRTTETAIKAGLATEEDLFNLEVRKIALASLTADIFAHVDGSGFNFYRHPSPTIEHALEQGDQVTPLFIAPPVPEIKIPDLLDIPDGLDLASAMAAINWYEMETKRLNGLGE